MKLTYEGRATAPGNACGALRRNRRDLHSEEIEGSILVAERAVPEDVGRILAAAGTVTFGGALLSHISLLSREFGKPSVSMGSSDTVHLLEGDHDLIGLDLPDGTDSFKVAEGEIVFLDGDRGLLIVPAGEDPSLRKAARDAYSALMLFGRDPGEERLLEPVRELLNRTGEALLSFLMEAAILYRVLPAGQATSSFLRFLEQAAPNDAVRSRKKELATEIEDRILRLISRASDDLAGVSEPDDLERRVCQVEEKFQDAFDLLAALGAERTPDRTGLQGYREEAETIRTAIREQVIRNVREMLEVPDELLAHRIGGLFQLLRRARAVHLDRSLTAPLQACLSRHLADERARAGAHLIVPMDTPEGVRDRSLVGGKAAGLFQIQSVLPPGCGMPWGFVITTSAYRLHLLGETGEKIREAITCDEDEMAISRKSKAAILGSEIPREVCDAMNKALTGHEKTRLAIRSSSTMEDGPVGSLAGQYDTYLGVSGQQEIHNRVRQAWASLWNHQAIRMLTAQGRSLSDPVQAILVQEMVATRCAGVLFSREPAGKPDTLLVNASWGLGEGVSQGEVAGDLYWVRLSTGDLIASETGKGETRIVLDPGRTGTVEEPLPESLKGRPCLDQENLRRLAELARNLETATGRGQDVEFGFTESGDLMVFQVRRVMPPRRQPTGTH
jgi:phosphohistidine swiveling domain-containing protein